MLLRSAFMFLFIAWLGCNEIENGDSLDPEDAARVQQLFKLDTDERILKFYSNYKPSVAGSFFTNKRVGSYWLDERNSTKNHVSSERYENLVAIDTFYNLGFPAVPYLAVTTRDSVQFRLAVDGELAEKKAFF